jgi:hypothetical protein
MNWLCNRFYKLKFYTEIQRDFNFFAVNIHTTIVTKKSSIKLKPFK